MLAIYFIFELNNPINWKSLPMFGYFLINLSFKSKSFNQVQSFKKKKVLNIARNFVMILLSLLIFVWWITSIQWIPISSCNEKKKHCKFEIDFRLATHSRQCTSFCMKIELNFINSSTTTSSNTKKLANAKPSFVNKLKIPIEIAEKNDSFSF